MKSESSEPNLAAGEIKIWGAQTWNAKTRGTAQWERRAYSNKSRQKEQSEIRPGERSPGGKSENPPRLYVR